MGGLIPFLNLREIRKSFGSRRVLGPLDLAIKHGEAVAIVGRSGCGKSTLLRILAGLENPSGGNFQQKDSLVRGLNSSARVMFQDATLVPWRTVLQNVALNLPKDQQHRATNALRQVGLLDRASDWPAKLSGGQRQRVALARALAAQPELLLLDEPLSALDALTRLEMQALIESVWQAHGFTLVLVTHDVEEAVALADRVLVMDEGLWIREAAIPLPRPRVRTDPQFVRLRAELLEAILSSGHASESASAAAIELRSEAPQRLPVDTSVAAGV